MAMYDLSADLLTFHDQHVKLDSDTEKKLAQVRNTNLDRIRNGLDVLGKPRFKDWRNQGGYAMGTVINDPAGASNHDFDARGGMLSSRPRPRRRGAIQHARRHRGAASDQLSRLPPERRRA